ncbi:hypothetical protein ABPG74_003850 [Tetrahymena malaccensis]
MSSYHQQTYNEPNILDNNNNNNNNNNKQHDLYNEEIPTGDCQQYHQNNFDQELFGYLQDGSTKLAPDNDPYGLYFDNFQHQQDPQSSENGNFANFVFGDQYNQYEGEQINNERQEEHYNSQNIQFVEDYDSQQNTQQDSKQAHNQLFNQNIQSSLIQSEDNLQQLKKTESMLSNHSNILAFSQGNYPNFYPQGQNYIQQPIFPIQTLPCFYPSDSYPQQQTLQQHQQPFKQNQQQLPFQNLEQRLQCQLLFQFDQSIQQLGCENNLQYPFSNPEMTEQKIKNLERKQNISQFEAPINKKIKVKEEQEIQQISNQNHEILIEKIPKSYQLDGLPFNLKNFYKNMMKKIAQHLVKIFEKKGQKKIVEFIKKVFPFNSCNNKHFLMLFNHLQQNNDPSTSIVNKIEMDYKFEETELEMLEKVREQAQILFSNKFYYLTRVYKAHKASKNIEQFYYGAIFYSERAKQEQFASKYIPFKDQLTKIKNVQSDLYEKLQKQYINTINSKN